MTRVKVRHYVVKRGKGFWQPTKAMRALGFYSVPCGHDGSDAWAVAESWNDRWDKTRRCEAPSPAMVAADNLSPERSEELTIYPPRALGGGFSTLSAHKRMGRQGTADARGLVARLETNKADLRRLRSAHRHARRRERVA
jgi:hypothetical protein